MNSPLGEGINPPSREFDEWGGKQAIRRGRWKLLRQGRWCTPILFGGLRHCLFPGVELHDPTVDPGESHDVAAEQPEPVAELEGLLGASRTPSPEFPLPFD